MESTIPLAYKITLVLALMALLMLGTFQVLASAAPETSPR